MKFPRLAPAVYAYGGHAVTDPSAFESEFDWRVRKLRELTATAAGPGEPGAP